MHHTGIFLQKLRKTTETRKASTPANIQTTISKIQVYSTTTILSCSAASQQPNFIWWHLIYVHPQYELVSCHPAGT